MTNQPDRLPALVDRYDRPGPRYTSYPTADTWGDLSPREHGDALGRIAGAPLSLYVHLPFCRSLCLYCGCNVVVTRKPEAADRYLDALETEMDLVLERLGPHPPVTQLHWGGGTPTFLDEAQLGRLHAAITRRFDVQPGAEVAIEIDPRVTSTGQLRLLRQLGFARLSMGVQDLAPEVQQAIGRHQDVASTRAFVETARALGFDQVNFDLIYGLPLQTPESWRTTLALVAELAPDRIAAYSFAYMPGLRRQQNKLRLYDRPTGAAKLRLLLDAQAVFGEAGYRAIGMDHFARPHDELALAQARGDLQRNFQGYTVKAARDVVALGASAISDLGGAVYAQNARDLPAYYQAIEGRQLATVRGHHLDENDRRRRVLIESLMCNFRVALEGAEEAAFGGELAALAPLQSDGLVEVRGGRVEVTDLGRLFVRNIAMVFDARRTGDGLQQASRTI